MGLGPLEAQQTRMRILLTRPTNVFVMLLLDACIWLQRTDVVDLRNRVQDIPSQFIYDVYDFVVIGGGSAGCAMAARLSEVCDWNVLLLEAGGDESFISDLPYLYPVLQKSKMDWQFETEPNERFCRGMRDNRCSWPRGKVLGGSSVLNAMMYVRGNREDYDEWASLGNVGWSWRDVLPYFVKMENVRDERIARQPWHGRTGPMTVELVRNRSELQPYFLRAAQQLGERMADEVNGPDQLVFAPLHGSLRDGLRCSTAKAYLRPVAQRKNLHISMNTVVEKILIDPRDKRAYGVQFRKGNRLQYVMATKEIILSAGALNSPHLLMLSGVGPRDQLQAHGIPVLQELPGVGRNLQDHVAAGGGVFLIQNPDRDGRPLSIRMTQVVQIDTARDFLYHNNGRLVSMPSCEVMGFINTKYNQPGSRRPDVQIFMSAQSDISDGGVESAQGAGLTYDYYSRNFESWVYKDSFLVMPLLMRPKSRGWLELPSANPRDKIKIHPNYFAFERDLDILVEGLKFAVQVAETPEMRRLNATFIYDKAHDDTCRGEKGDNFFKCLITHYSQTIYHPCGTAKMGPSSDPMAVVDDQLRVHGIGGLRVVDASIMPTITTGNTNAPVIMIAERAADLLKYAHLPALLTETHYSQCESINFLYHPGEVKTVPGSGMQRRMKV
ncbi:choline dehydrogenase [Anopheles darlingi]|uniref:Choline dehydrogenase n=1 Tax=Anopheles darlingi TaxID=43151 RepID=W5J6D8_ANODA|nr:choline dehydrogenase [Anopheles darlingi]